MRKSLLPFVGLLVVVAVVAAVSCLLTGHYFGNSKSAHKHDLHRWVHEQLGITTEQEKQLEPIEARYQEQRRHYEEMIKIANRELATAILHDKGNSPNTSLAVENSHHALGELQKATLNHVFEMKAILRPDQYEKLLRLTADGLNEISQD